MNLQAPAASKAAIDLLTHDYVTYHLVFGAGGALAAIAALGLAAVSLLKLTQLRRAPAAHDARFACRTYAAFTTLGLLTAAGMTLLVWANLANALSPAAGLADAMTVVSGQATMSPRGEVQEAGAVWLRSRDAAIPPALKQAIAARRSWQAPKAIASTLALMVALIIAVLWWNGLIRQSLRAQPASGSGMTWRISVAIGCLMAPVCLILLALSLANAQASIAPVVLTLTLG